MAFQYCTLSQSIHYAWFVIEPHTSFNGDDTAWLVSDVTMCVSLTLTELGLSGFYDKRMKSLVRCDSNTRRQQSHRINKSFSLKCPKGDFNA